MNDYMFDINRFIDDVDRICPTPDFGNIEEASIEEPENSVE